MPISRSIRGLVGLLVGATMLVASPGVFAADSPISVSSISASFFPNPNDSGAFTATPATAVTFTQEFPALNFNTPADTVKCSNQTGVSPSTQPFTNVIPQPDGSCKTIVAQGNNKQAAVGEMRNFQAVFTGAFQVAAAGRITFDVYSDDGWILSIGPNAGGAQPGYVSGPMLNFPRVGPFTGYPIVGSYNVASAPNQNNLVVGFPAAGIYPFELDYSDCCSGTQALTILANGAPIPPSSGLTLDVQGIADGATVQGAQRLTVVAIGGQPQQVELLVDGASQGVKTAPPFTFDWNPSTAGAGPHTIVVRATDPSGPVEKQLTVQVTAPSATAVASPVPTQTTTSPGNPSPNFSQFTQPLLIGGGILALLILAAVGVYLFFFIRERQNKQPKPKPAPEPVIAEVVPAVDESTEFIGRVPLENLTMVSNRRQVAVLPKASLLVKPDREIELSRFKETVIGRDSTNAAYVDDRQVSRHHARILVVDGDFWIEDLNSTNGTRVNGTTVTKQKLANNDMINVGDTTMTFALEQS